MTLEQQIQKKIIDFLEKQQGCYCIKTIKVNKNGFPDIIVLTGEGQCFFIEVKTEKGVVSKLQQFRIKELEKLGYKVLVPKGFDDFIEQFMGLTI